MFARLRHHAIGGGDDDNRAVHLGRAGDHIFDVIGMAGRVDVRVVASIGRILVMRESNGNTALALLWGVINILNFL